MIDLKTQGATFTAWVLEKQHQLRSDRLRSEKKTKLLNQKKINRYEQARAKQTR